MNVFKLHFVFLFLGLLTLTPQTKAEGTQGDLIDQYLRNKIIVLDGPELAKPHVIQWFKTILANPVGKQTLRAFAKTHHQLTLEDSPTSRIVSGITNAPMTSNLTNGRGEDPTIKIDFLMPDEGVQTVYSMSGKTISFPAPLVLFHELGHAYHMARGTFAAGDIERQAIEIENQYRAMEAGAAHTSPQSQSDLLRGGIEGEDIEQSMNLSEGVIQNQHFRGTREEVLKALAAAAKLNPEREPN